LNRVCEHAPNIFFSRCLRHLCQINVTCDWLLAEQCEWAGVFPTRIMEVSWLLSRRGRWRRLGNEKCGAWRASAPRLLFPPMIICAASHVWCTPSYPSFNLLNWRPLGAILVTPGNFVLELLMGGRVGPRPADSLINRGYGNLSATFPLWTVARDIVGGDAEICPVPWAEGDASTRRYGGAGKPNGEKTRKG
jgi:hypothetical protein